jgi:hypothetical protein
MGKASSNKKVARAAKAGASSGLSRRAGNTSWGYYGSIVGAVVVGTVLLVVSIGGQGANATPPTLNDHWHAAYGIYDCDHYLPNINGGSFDVTGIHAHDDGLIHIHPVTSAVTGKRAVLGEFAKTLSMELSNSEIVHEASGINLQASQKCGEKTATVRYLSFRSAEDTKPVVLTGNPDKIRLAQGQIIAMVRAPKDAKIPAPPSSATLNAPADLQGATTNDFGQPNSATSTPTDASPTVGGAASTTVAGSTTIAGGASTTVAPTAGAPTSGTAGATTTKG